ncbi:MAG: DEAD/DEAH box helicase [Deltaproteobacteria bacterium]|nr:DEAD/DEAH box helicase [Deltaproteobacteria bacterium]
MVLESFHPLVSAWFSQRFAAPTRPQVEGWRQIGAGLDTLIAAPTGSGKTLAAFLFCLDDLVKRGLAGALEGGTQVLYVSPLKALSNDVSKNLAIPLQEIRKGAGAAGLALPPLEIAVRTGDTSAAERVKLAKSPPHVLVTTPESLFILLTSGSGRAALKNVRTVIVDEIHAVAGDKRGAHLSLSLERLDALVRSAGRSAPQRIGLSATQRPIELIGSLLVGAGRPAPVIVDAGFARDLDLAIEVPRDELGAVATHEMMDELYDRIAELSRSHQTTLVFANTRRLVERAARHLAERLGDDCVAAHHGSLSQKTRLRTEDALKEGRVRCVVATASLELGIDIGSVDLVAQIGSPRSIATFLQRVGRSGHSLGATPKGRLFPLTRDQLVESAALIRAVRAGELDRLEVRRAPLDILAQQIVAMAASEPWEEERLFTLVRRAHPYRELEREDFDDVLEMLSEGFARGRGRIGAHLHRDRVGGVVRGRRGAGLTAMTSGGAIPERADYAVICDPEETFVGTLDEDFAIESMAGDIFQLGNTSWQILRVESGRVRVADARGAPPTIPFWRGEAPARTRELSEQVSALRSEVEARLASNQDRGEIAGWVAEASSVSPLGARELVDYLALGRAALGALPTKDTLIAERFFDESGSMQLVIHSPLGGRLNRAFGLALRKRFCVGFDFELQAAATDDALLISLGPMHSFPLAEVFDFVSPATAEDSLTQAVLRTPFFTARWRWNAQRALAVPRQRGGKRVPAPLLRMQTDDLLSGVFPDLVACQDNISGPLVVPEHPLVGETLRDCLTEAMDLAGLIELLERVRRGEIRVLAKDTVEPSVLSHEILNANPYAYLDDAPLEERRARAVQTRRGLNSEVEPGLAALDPAAIATVEADLAPRVRSADELHDVLSLSLVMPAAETTEWRAQLAELIAAGRATEARVPSGEAYFVPREQLGRIRLAYGEITFSPDLTPLAFERPPATAEEAQKCVVRAALESSGPRTARELSARLSLAGVEPALLQLEAEGAILRGRFRAERAPEEIEWCDRRILARIHRLTLGRLRREIEPVSPADLMRFLLRWQHAAPGRALGGLQGVLHVVRQLQGIELPAAAWESAILPQRVAGYAGGLLDQLSLAGEITWGRLGARAGGDGRMLRKETPIALWLPDQTGWLREAPPDAPPHLTPVARAVRDHLARAGACFPRDLAAATGSGRAETEDALRELAFAGLVTSDGFSGLRALFDAERAPVGGGRWSLLRDGDEGGDEDERSIEAAARQLMARWGVLVRDLLERETRRWAWRDLLRVLRRLEARGEIRGGRFVSGVTGEQYALPEAVELLRQVRRDEREDQVVVSAADPLNLTGIITPGPRTATSLAHRVIWIRGAPSDYSEAASARSTSLGA